MPAKISKSTSAPRTFESPLELSRFGAQGAGTVFIDSEGSTFIGTIPAGGIVGLKVVSVTADGRVLRMAERLVHWPLRIAPSDHLVTFSNAD